MRNDDHFFVWIKSGIEDDLYARRQPAIRRHQDFPIGFQTKLVLGIDRKSLWDNPIAMAGHTASSKFRVLSGSSGLPHEQIEMIPASVHQPYAA